MACNLAHNFGHPLLGSFPMQDNMLFGCHGAEGKLIHAASVDDALGELREEEIVWGEAEMHHQFKDVSSGADRSNGKVGMPINRGDHRVMRHRSMLSRQIETQANTWSAGSTMSTMRVVKQSVKGSVHKATADHKDQDAEVGGGEEEVGIQQHMDELVPPHELLARQYAATATSSFSVLHGAGRTLKGRDLRRLRNEVWRQTGFAD